uniref:Hymenoptaecin n=1 Tax=Panagrellus redivivus TaxID=6233 RepID=A0A7E4UL48_PANRE
MLSRLSSILLAVMVLVVGTVQAKPFSMRRVDYFNNLRQMLPRDSDSPIRLVPTYIRDSAPDARTHLNPMDNGQLYSDVGSPPQAPSTNAEFDGYGPTGAKRAHLLRLANQAARGFGK